MKTCTKCGVAQSEEQFSWRVKNVRRAAQCKDCHRAYRKSHYQANRQKYIDKAQVQHNKNGPTHLRHGISVDRWEEFLAMFNGMCWSCQAKPAKVVDHDHTCCPGPHSCGKCVRGLLCGSCNTGIGMLGDNENGLLRALEYLRRSSTTIWV